MIKKLNYRLSEFLTLAILSLLLFSCDSEQNYSIEPGTGPFSITILAPAAQSFVADTVHVLTAETGSRRLAKVEFYVDDELREKDFFAPYGFDWLTGGYTQSSEHSIKAVAYEWGGYLLDSTTIVVKVDNVSPSLIPDLAGANPTLFTANLSWTAPGNDGDSGNATFYDVRYRLSPINDRNWRTSTEVIGEPVPGPRGSIESMVVTGLSPNTTYYFAIEAADTVYNWSEVSNNIVVTTPPLFKPPVMISGLAGADESRVIATAFINQDTDVDIVLANQFSGTVSVLTGNGLGGFNPAAVYDVGAAPYDIESGDLNYDTYPDLVIPNLVSDGISVLFGRSDGSFEPERAFAAGNGCKAIAIGDFDNTGDLDLAVANMFSNEVVILRSFSDGNYSKTYTIKVDHFPSSIKSGDWNQDGNIDLAVVCRTDNSINIILGNGTGEFTNTMEITTENLPVALETADFNNDGIVDLITANSGSNSVSVFYGKGDGTFKAARSLAVSQGPNSIVLVDIDGDGDLDFLTPNSNNGTVSLAMGDGNGFFFAAATYYAGGLPTSLVVLDIDSDDDLDVLVAHDYGTTLSLLLNKINN